MSRQENRLKLVWLGMVCLAAGMLFAGEGNVLRNAGFAGDGLGGCLNWAVQDGRHDAVTLLKGEGPAGVDALRVDIASGRRLAQSPIRLVGDEPYRLSVFVRTKGLSSDSVRFMVWNDMWSEEIVVGRIPADTHGDWQELSWEGKMVGSKSGNYTCAFFVTDPKGIAPFDIASPSLVPLSEAAKAKTVSAPEQKAVPARIVPIAPRLYDVDSVTGRLAFYYPGVLESAPADYDLEATVDGEVKKVKPLRDDARAEVAFGALPEGQHKLAVRLVRGTVEIAANDYAIRVVRHAPASGRRLNNFVTEYLRTEAKAGEFRFNNPRPGWVYFSVGTAEPGAKGFLDGVSDPVLRHRPGERFETMRYLGVGDHTLTLNGPVGGALRVHGVLNYVNSAGGNPLAMDTDLVNYRYGREFYRKNQIGCFNTVVGYGYDAKLPCADAYRERGIMLAGECGIEAMSEPFIVREKLHESLFTSPPYRDGLCLMVDESSINHPRIAHYNVAEETWLTADRPNAIGFWWCDSMTRTFADPKVQASEISAIANSGCGQGLLYSETYFSVLPDEQAAYAQEDHYVRLLKSITDMVPVSPAPLSLCLGGYIEAGGWCNYSSPKGDIKVLYDHALRRFATDPAFADLGGLGMTSFWHMDEELVRWFVRVWRHYALDGETTSLAAAYGYRYNPNHLRDPDFEKGFADWEAHPAADGALVATTLKGYGTKVQSRKDVPGGFGDTAALFTRGEADGSVLRAKLTGLTPGTLYSVSYYVADYATAEKAALHPKGMGQGPALELQFSVGDGGCELTQLATRRASPKFPCRTYRNVFRATAAEATVSFDDTAAAPGARTLLNGICVRPYFND